MDYFWIRRRLSGGDCCFCEAEGEMRLCSLEGETKRILGGGAEAPALLQIGTGVGGLAFTRRQTCYAVRFQLLHAPCDVRADVRGIYHRP